jgi:hypothetical protein
MQLSSTKYHLDVYCMHQKVVLDRQINYILILKFKNPGQ